jgi:hemerythrin
MDITNVEKAAWKDEYSMGNKIIDKQHKGLFETFNSLVEALSVNSVVESKAQEILITLVDYMQTHFSDEEAFWKKDAAIYQNHRKAHYSFVQMVMGATRKDLKKEDFTPDLLIFIRDWLADHIIKMDQEDYKKLRERGLLQNM